MPPCRIEIHPKLDLLHDEVDSLDVCPIHPAHFVGHAYGQSGRFHEKFGDVVLQPAAPEAGSASGTVRPLLHTLAGGGDPLVAVPTPPQDPIVTSRWSRVDVAARNGQIP